MLAAQADYTAIILSQTVFPLFMALFLFHSAFAFINLTVNCNIYPRL